MKVRIQKLLADAGVESRRHVEEMVLAGRIAVNGKNVRALPVMVDPAADAVTIDGQPIDLPAAQSLDKIYVILNKPKGVYCTNVAQGEQQRAIDLLPPEIDRRVYPVGRLDADSRGLLLLTNDGELTQQMTHPKFGVAKTYTAVVDGFVKPDTIERLTGGIWLADPEKGGFKTGRTFIKVVKRGHTHSVLQITIREGRNRQVRRMLAGVGHKVRELTRTRIGPLELGKLKAGDHRVLHAWEIEKLREAIKPKARGDGPSAPRADDARAKRPPGPATSTGKRPAGPRPAGRPKATPTANRPQRPAGGKARPPRRRQP